MKLIGFTGSMGSGKSTAIKCLSELQHSPVENIKFAQPLYDIQSYAYERIKAVYKRSDDFVKDRKLLQWLGTEWGRETLSKDLWIELWKAEIRHISENYPHIFLVCDDVRYDNEADAIKELGGHLIKIESNKNGERINIKSGITGHASEGGIDLKKIDYILENNGTIDDLKTSLLTFNVEKALW